MRRIGLPSAWLATLVVVAAMISGALGWLSPRQAFDLGMGAVAFGGLWLVVWLPWDLYFAARAVAYDQADSVAAGIDVPARDREHSARLIPRLLLGCVSLHVLGALLLAAVTWLSDGRVGYYFAGSFVLAMALRPLGAAYGHIRARLDAMRDRARYPREDIVQLRARLEQLEVTVEGVTRTDLPELSASDRRLEDEFRATADEAQRREARYGKKVDDVLTELERSMARLTEDRELLRGIRAFVRVVKQS